MVWDHKVQQKSIPDLDYFSRFVTYKITTSMSSRQTNQPIDSERIFFQYFCAMHQKKQLQGVSGPLPSAPPAAAYQEGVNGPAVHPAATGMTALKTTSFGSEGGARECSPLLAPGFFWRGNMYSPTKSLLKPLLKGTT